MQRALLIADCGADSEVMRAEPSPGTAGTASAPSVTRGRRHRLLPWELRSRAIYLYTIYLCVNVCVQRWSSCFRPVCKGECKGLLSICYISWAQKWSHLSWKGFKIISAQSQDTRNAPKGKKRCFKRMVWVIFRWEAAQADMNRNTRKNKVKTLDSQ